MEAPDAIANRGLQNLDAPSLPSAASSHRIAAGKDGSWFLATANGGVWRTKNITAEEPTWESVTDGQPVTCAAMAALDVASFDTNLVAAGCGGSTSGEMGDNWNELINGDWRGVMFSTDGGDSFRMTDFPEHYNVASVKWIKQGESPVLMVAARSHFFDRQKGGVWIAQKGHSSFTQVFDKPTVDLVYDQQTKTLFAALGEDANTVYASKDSGKTWKLWSEGLSWGKYTPYYANLAVSTPLMKNPTVFLAAYAVNPSNSSDTVSVLWYRAIEGGGVWKRVANTPCGLDNDHMPKDKIAILADPKEYDTLYLVANVNYFFRIQWQQGTWTSMGAEDTVDGAIPHGDCRHLAWDFQNDNLIMTNDGGVHTRINPRSKGGRWVGSVGNIGTMEFLYAHWDSRLERFVGGAQDNDVQVSLPRAKGEMRSMGLFGGDGAKTDVDNVHCPARLFGSVQNLDAMSYVQGDPLEIVPLRISETFKSVWNFPDFVVACGLNTQNPDEFLFFVNASEPGYKKGIYMINVPGPTSTEKLKPKMALQTNDHILAFVAGGYTDNKPDSSLIIAVSATTFYYQTSGVLKTHPLPNLFFTPIDFVLEIDNNWILGPLSHGSTMFVSASPANSSRVVVTGWPAFLLGSEAIFFSGDAGATWQNIFGDLSDALENPAKVRPQGIKIIEFTEEGFDAIVVGTVNGVFVSYIDHSHSDDTQHWTRFGQSSGGVPKFPLVMVAGLSYEHYSDTLVAATYGRGVYTIENAKMELYRHKIQLEQKTCQVKDPPKPQSSARLFPPQEACT